MFCPRLVVLVTLTYMSNVNKAWLFVQGLYLICTNPLLSWLGHLAKHANLYMDKSKLCELGQVIQAAVAEAAFSVSLSVYMSVNSYTIRVGLRDI